jgi:hypothetical protein
MRSSAFLEAQEKRMQDGVFHSTLAQFLKCSRQMFRLSPGQWFKEKYANDPAFREDQKRKAREQWQAKKSDPDASDNAAKIDHVTAHQPQLAIAIC